MFSLKNMYNGPVARQLEQELALHICISQASMASFNTKVSIEVPSDDNWVVPVFINEALNNVETMEVFINM